ncbi:MAG: T3/T7 RNA polymerase, partial [Acidobacteriota bacterium]|nr:T3/T7 RNA polymerase [Acidobacteriota bacterium]
LDHEREILDSALSPLDGQLFWHGAENPWQFLASCFEWAGYKVQGDSYVSHLPVNMDGSCSGLQHYSALLLDASGGAEVNLVPSSKPSDIYTAVAKRAQALVDSSVDAASAVWKNGKVIRKIVKQPTMTMCYAATQYGMRQQIEMALRKLDDGQEGSYLGAEENFQASVYLSKVVWESINATVVAARRGMDFLKGCATAMAAVHLPVDWQTPVGFLVSQMYSEAVGKKVEVHYNGARLMLTVRKEGDEVDGRAQAAGIAPNFVHSLDSAHLMATVLRGKSEGIDYWSVIHDSFGTHACNVGILNACLRDTFVEQYSVDRLTEFRDGLMEQLKARGESVELPEVPGTGTLDLEAVRRSEFFFA